jgi:hypothetical protein
MPVSFPATQVAQFLNSLYDEERAKEDLDFVEGVHTVVKERNTFGLQKLLPQLPVPKLEDTIRRYLKSIKAVQLDADAYARSEATAMAFLASDCAAKLQHALEQRARDCVTNARGYPHTHWLEEWWENLAYLSGRDPLAINLNCFGTMLSGLSLDFGPLASTATLVATRAAAVIYGTMQFVYALDSATLGPEALGPGKAPLCMSQFKRVFRSVRQPGEHQDAIVQHEMPADQAPHVAVWCEGQWFCLPVVRGDQRAAAGGDASSSLATFISYLQAVQAVRADAQQRRRRQQQQKEEEKAAEDHDLPLAVLTSAERTFWSRARDYLRGTSPAAAEALRMVESAEFHVVLSNARCDVLTSWPY